MPEIDEVKRGYEIGIKDHHKYIWHICLKCGNSKWVKLIKGEPQSKRCRHCAERGEKSNRWNGGRKIRNGYISVWLSPDDFFFPMVDKLGYVFEHRLIVARTLGRCLHSWEIVHHKGVKYPSGSIENKQDNRYPENLQLVQEMQHQQITIMENKIHRLESKVEDQAKQIRLLQWQIREAIGII